MTRAAVRERLRSRGVQAVLVVVLLLIAAGIAAGVTGGAPNITTRSQFVTGTPEHGTRVELDTTLYLPEHTPAPAVLLAQGFGGDKSGLDGTARTLAEHGYVALAYTARGFGRSGGLIHFDSPQYEVRDAQKLVTYLTRLPQVDRSRIGVAGSSYGGGLALLLAGTDKRIAAVAADITWNDLSHALFPNAVGGRPGVFKKLWAGELFGNAFPANIAPGGVEIPTGITPSGVSPSGFGSAGGGARGDDRRIAGGTDVNGTTGCGRFAPAVCAAYQYAARTGRPNAALRRLMRAASPATVLDRITAPTLLTQGEQDSLFPLSEADANARGIAANGTPVGVVWRLGGHDDPADGTGTATGQMLSWFDDTIGDPHGHVARRQQFRYGELSGAVSSTTGQEREQSRLADGYPGIAGTKPHAKRLTLFGPAQRISAPAGGTPATVTDIPGLAGLLGQFGALGGGGAGGVSVPGAVGQTAYFASGQLSGTVPLVGSSTVRLRVTSHGPSDVTLFAALHDLDPDGTISLPQQLVAPLRLTGMRAGKARTVTVHLPSIVRTLPAGHRLVLSVATTDFAYQLPQDPRSYTVSLAKDATLTVPVVHGRTLRYGHPLAWLIAGAGVVLAAIMLVTLVIRRRRGVVSRAPELADVPVTITGLVKEYAGGYRAVDDVTFSVERGQVVGLLGPNGAGKTTTLRVLVGLITPTAGTVHVFGEPVTPGASVLARLGAFIEGPGFLPHLSGRENLRLYWAATGRPPDEADFDTALDIAGLGASVDLRVRTYSHGMKQRLGIAQAMLGLPELLVLDEPTNGLDPPQIAEMREVLRRYADTGRTVVVSSHLLAEVEQTCTHVVVMHKGRLVKAGAVVDLAGPDSVQLAVDDPTQAAKLLAEAGIAASLVPTRRALEDVFLDLIGGE